MFVGHALAAFALAALGAQRLGASRAVALRIAVVAGLFATVPDVDVAYGLVGLLGAGADPESFWAAGNQVHRGVTHSLLVGTVTALAAGLIAVRGPESRAVGAAALAALAVFVAVHSGPLAGAIAALFAIAAVAVVALAARLSLSPTAVGAAALVGLLSHPFGDVFTGSPPGLLYPLDATVLTDRMVLSADPTLHLLGAFWTELAIVWLALAVALRLTGRRLATNVDRRAALGVGYAAAAVALPAPTLDVSYHFVFSVLAVGTVGVAPLSFGRTFAIEEFASWRTVATALTAITVASVAYAIVYVAV